jgi:serine/threonine protein kinase
MSANMLEFTTDNRPVSLANPPRGAVEYSEILNYYGLAYIQADYYWQIGQINHVQGWVLHLSAIISQVGTLIESVIPFLAEKNIPFKIPLHKDISRNILYGYMGTPQVGKIVSIYPDNPDEALKFAKRLVIMFKDFRGPAIPTDIHLGAIVYTRYGSCNPIIKISSNGKKEKYIYDDKGQLIKDPYSTPFKLPEYVSWPYSELASPIPITRSKILNNLYKPQFRLKTDARGNVYKGLYIKGLFQAAPCVIKQGKKYMGSEDCGRDIRDKLLWQQYLHQRLAHIIPLPKLIDLFEEQGDTYLVMELIKGTTLHDRCKEINFNLRAWRALDLREKTILLDYLLQILSYISQLHENGFVHRDIQPSNFLIDAQEKIFLIDVELAWSIKEGIPDPPFELGTPGFMSPEQFAIAKPTIKEDIYGFSGLIISVFTGLSPAKFNVQQDRLRNTLDFLIGNKALADLVASCRTFDPLRRPELTIIESTLREYRKDLEFENILHKQDRRFPGPDPILVHKSIIEGLAGLNKAPIAIFDDLWYSKDTRTENRDTPEQKEYTPLLGLREGIGGVLYLLARARRMGYIIDSSLKSYYKGFDYIIEHCFNHPQSMMAGLYEGSSGIAITLVEGIRSGLLDDNKKNRCRIEASLQLPYNGLDIASGAAGQGVAILQCSEYLHLDLKQKLLKQCLYLILDKQEKDGSWVCNEEMPGKKHTKSIGFAHGVSGITWFILEYMSRFKDATIKHSAIKGLNWLRHRTKDLESLFDSKSFKKLMPNAIQDGDERVGILRTFIKGYEVLKQYHYRTLAEKALGKYPLFVVTNNFTQDTGLSGLGELYIEAKRIFGTEVWQTRADWIAQVFIHTAIQNYEGICYWQMEENHLPTADLLVGNSGILHFLMHYLNPEKLGDCLLS